MVLKIFLRFVLLGFYSFGGGYVFLPLMESELVEKLGWITKEQFVIALTAGQISPGPVAVAGSFAGFLAGYNYFKSVPMAILCSFMAWAGTNVATIVCMGAIMKMYKKIEGSPFTGYIRHFIMPVVVGLILYLAVKMGISYMISWPQIVIAVVAFAIAYSRKIDFAFIIIGGGLIGYFFLK
ncbi:MAG: chromate transporter [Candidatus Eremiobacteraeota bacterium]|nr:chromate transporter [Candidatus Eremiobacteraeota bacterium]